MNNRNDKVIVLSGYARGGTNIVWNILQSHPEICSPIFETGEVFDKSFVLKAIKLLSKIRTFNFCKELIDSKLYQFKLKNLEHPENKYIAKNELYTKEQVQESTLCTKSVNSDIHITELLLEVYPHLYFIGLSRNGYALAESYIRRGRTAKEAGEIYSDIANQMKKYSRVIKNFKLIKFEDCLVNPFAMATDLFSFLEMEEKQLDMLRLKSKKIVKDNDQHSTKYGKENRKYWFDKEGINQILDPDVNQKQIEKLSDNQIEAFNHEAENALKYFGYNLVS